MPPPPTTPWNCGGNVVSLLLRVRQIPARYIKWSQPKDLRTSNIAVVTSQFPHGNVSPLSTSCSRWRARKRRSWRGRTGCATWRRLPATPSTWSTPSPSWPKTSSPWCGPATSPSRKAGRAWRAGSSPMWFTPQRRWRRATAAVYVNFGKRFANEIEKEKDAGWI